MERRLGRGLSELIDSSSQPDSNLVMLKIDQIRPGRYQPRETIDEPGLEELKASIKRHGILEPVLVRPLAHGIYELVAGERRWRAAQAVGIQEVPAIVRTLNDQETIELSLVENIQREDLNAVEEARTYARLTNEFGYTQDQVAEAVGKNRSSISNSLRLLKLPPEILEGLRSGKITEGHAKAILALELPARQLEVFQRAVSSKLSVRQTEQLVAGQQPRRTRRRAAGDAETGDLEARLRQSLGTKVTLLPRRKGGRIVIEYFSREDLARLLGVLGARPS